MRPKLKALEYYVILEDSVSEALPLMEAHDCAILEAQVNASDGLSYTRKAYVRNGLICFEYWVVDVSGKHRCVVLLEEAE